MALNTTQKNTLFYGDNLKILREYLADDSVDLVYLDPPFSSNRNYNALFRNENGTASAAQIMAFEDTWHWNDTTTMTYHELVTMAAPNVATMLDALWKFIGENQMLAYLVMMAARLIELHRVLKPTGSLYLHCDPTASRYLGIVLDAIFGAQNFRNEIIWKRTTAHSDSTGWGSVHDVVLFYTKSANMTWNNVYMPYDEEYKQRYKRSDTDGRRWTDDNLTAKGLSGGGYTYEYKGVTSFWRVPLKTMERLDAEGRLHFTKNGGIRFKRYLDELPGLPIQDVIMDVFPINSQAAERLGYPTQKPVALLERIVEASSNEGDIVLDPFCGCGTTIHAAQRLNRRWIGIDITHLAIALQKYRLKDAFNLVEKRDYTVIGEPEDVQGACQLAQDDPYQFQWWALSLIQAQPLGAPASPLHFGEGNEGRGCKQGKKGKDRGIDGIITFLDDAAGKLKRLLVQVKSGNVKSGDIRDLRGTIEREQAEMGVFITLEKPSRDMEAEAAAAGVYVSKGWNKAYPKIQIFTIAQLLAGAAVQMPPTGMTFKKAQREEPHPAQQKQLL